MAQDKPKPVKIKASAIQVDMIHSDEIKLPAEFQVSMYEDLIRQLQKKGGFAHVYREGDRNAASSPGASDPAQQRDRIQRGKPAETGSNDRRGRDGDQDSLRFFG